MPGLSASSENAQLKLDRDRKKARTDYRQIRDLDEEHGLGRASFVNRTGHVTTKAKRAANRCHAWEYPSSVPMSCFLSPPR